MGGEIQPTQDEIEWMLMKNIDEKLKKFIKVQHFNFYAFFEFFDFSEVFDVQSDRM